MSRLEKRLRYLRSAEAFFVIGLPLVFIFFWTGKEKNIDWSLRIPALMLISYLLLQGAFYWHLKLASVKRRIGLPTFFHNLFHAFKWSNVLALSAFFIFFIFKIKDEAAVSDIAWSGGLFVFAVLEHINYYSHQLMYDTTEIIDSLRRNRRLRKAALAVDLRRAT